MIFMKTEVTTIKQKVVIPASPKEVYEAYVDAKKHSKFTGSKATGKAVVGGKFTAWDGYIFGKNLELEDGKTCSSRVDDDGLAKRLSSFKIRVDFQRRSLKEQKF